MLLATVNLNGLIDIHCLMQMDSIDLVDIFICV